VPVHDQFGGLAAAISVVVESARAKPRVLARMLADASTEITRRLAAQSGQHMIGPRQSGQPLAGYARASARPRGGGFAPAADPMSARVGTPA
jgi:hypothetical protein